MWTCILGGQTTGSLVHRGTFRVGSLERFFLVGTNEVCRVSRDQVPSFSGSVYECDWTTVSGETFPSGTYSEPVSYLVFFYLVECRVDCVPVHCFDVERETLNDQQTHTVVGV